MLFERSQAVCLNIDLVMFSNLLTMCNKKSVEDEYNFILECDRYTDIRCKYI